MTVAQDGTVYIADAGESNRIRKISPEGILSTLAGANEGYADGAGASGSFNTPSGLALAPDGNLLVADTGNNRIRKVTPEGQVTTVAGDGTAGYRDGPAAQAQFNGVIGVAVGTNGNIYVADSYNDRIRVITPNGQVSTLTGTGTPGFADGDRSIAMFDTPCALVVTKDGSLIVADTGNDRLRKVAPDGNVTTLGVVTPMGTVFRGRLAWPCRTMTFSTFRRCIARVLFKSHPTELHALSRKKALGSRLELRFHRAATSPHDCMLPKRQLSGSKVGPKRRSHGSRSRI